MGIQSGKSVESVSPKEEKESYGGKDLQKTKSLKPGINERGGDGILITIMTNLSSITTVDNSII